MHDMLRTGAIYVPYERMYYEFTQSRSHLTLDHGFRTVAIDWIALLSADQREM